jgi:hypothetical protein
LQENQVNRNILLADGGKTFTDNTKLEADPG